MARRFLRIGVLTVVCMSPAANGVAQVTRADYDRASGMRERVDGLAVNVPDPPTWIGDSSRFWYRKTVPGGHQFVTIDAATLQRQPSFDHAALANVLAKQTGVSVTAVTLPFNTFRVVDNERAIEFQVDQARWRCVLADMACTKADSPAGPPVPEGALRGVNGPVRGPHVPMSTTPRRSPDGKWEAIVHNFNLAIRPVGGGATTVLSVDGTEGDAYEPASVQWSPDSTKLAAYRVKPGYRRTVHYVESSPEDQLQPRHWTLQYAKPGDVLDRELPFIFQVSPVRAIPIANDLFPNPYELGDLAWRADSRAVTFEYNQRGHQVYRVIEADATTGAARAVVSEEPKTFFYYNRSNDTLSSGKRFRHDLDDGRRVIWMSERDGWNHLYLIDAATGAATQITKGDWAVRNVQHVDAEKKQIWFSAGGMSPGKDPYFLHYYRINFDGTGLTPLTTADADHQVRYSADMQLYVDTYSRVDQAPVSELRKASDGSLVSEIERSDITALVKAGWKAPEVFVSKGRDGRTDIWGLIFRPSNMDPSRKYAVIENIYGGPHGSHVPKTFNEFYASQAQAELGFIVVQIDGMGTSNRSKAFHDVAWQNLGDAGFPDRNLWHKAAAAKYPYYDVTRVGIYGGSAGGQNSMGALLFHPEFYKVAVSYAGCHDNRMDKIWWNEQWMGWPIAAQYSASSNVDNAARLQGRLLLVVGELDTNVDPASTMQVVSGLIRANKTFDLIVVPGENHNAGRGGRAAAYGERARFDFFVRHLMGAQPPDWNQDPGRRPTSTAQRQ
jgi:dipeptidyl aminopeptidase/acylaminoacyl peptidase